jgi:folate-dependent phosphoribosylglycinamide formyltransferase PurN
MLKKLHDPEKGIMRVVGMVSGSGKSVVSIIDRQKEKRAVGENNFEVVGIFTDNPDSQAAAIAESFNRPLLVNNIHQFYQERGRPISDLKVREAYDRETVRMLKPLKPDLLVFAGYVWVATHALVEAFQIINAHPADLSVMKGTHRAYAGADGIGAALMAGERQLHSSVHLVNTEVDGGPILLISKPVPVEEDPGLDSRERWRKYLRLVNQLQRQLVPLAVEKMASGDFASDDNGLIHHQGEAIPHGLRL